MNEINSKHLDDRERLTRQLADTIINSTKELIDPATDPKAINRIRTEVKERLDFEANLAVNEIVTRFSAKKEKIEVPEDQKERTFLRFGKNFRAQHMLMLVSCLILIFTGIPLKFANFGISKFIIIDVCGGLENSTLIHRIAAVGLIIVGVWHLLYTFMTRVGWRDFILMIPTLTDIKDFIHTILYYIGRKPSGPKFGRFSFIEKFDYWAVYWGMVIMIGSGLILWFKEMVPKYGFDIAREAHSDEGLLATLAIVMWHFYNVHFNPEVFPMSWVWWHGKLTEDEMKHHHRLEYDEILKAEREKLNGKADQPDNKGDDS